MFTKSARFYNTIYSSLGKDYAAESLKIHELVTQYKHSTGNTLLDVACGTGLHAINLSQHYQVEGLDLDAELLAVAKANYQQIPFHQGEMVDFSLNKKFDVVTCLFSSIGYVKTNSRLKQAISNMANHVLAGGVLLIEPWFSPEQWQPGTLSAAFVNEPDLKISRMSIAEVKDTLSILNFHYQVGTEDGIENFTELHELGLFTRAQYLDAFRSAELQVVHDQDGLTGRGLYIGIKN
jgi:ubiquinone/menaquinone biosynthesis C-methylase UbiE